jgi:hypothetical protein
MNKASITLIVDAIINYALGILCILYPFVAETIGVPIVENSFYPTILGAVLIGIGIALTIECYRKQGGMVGLGLGGAVAINLSGGLVLILWLIFGDLNIPLRGHFFLWSLAIILVGISLIEIYIHLENST